MAVAAPKFQRMAFVFKDDTKKDHRVYDALFLKERVPTWFTGCSATILKVIEKQKIPVDKYYFASFSAKSGYKECSAEYKSRKLLIDADWVEAHVPGFGSHPPAPSPAKIQEKPAKVYAPAPPYLVLNEDEKFKNEKGETLDIEVRGERHYDKLWFKAKDVEEMMGMENVNGTLVSSTSTYERGIHFETFDLIPPSGIPDKGDQKKNANELAMFLSYWGLVKMLFTRKNPLAVHFQRWAIEKLFTIQMGSIDDKQNLAADILGVTPKALKAVLATNVSSLPVVYLFELGNVKDLRESLNIPQDFKDDQIVVKYGLTQDLKRRTGEHESSFAKVKHAKMSMKYHVYIDPLYLSNAEQDIEHYFIGAHWHLRHAKHTELAAIPEHMLNSIVQLEFKRLGNAYAGKLADLQTQLANEAKINAQLQVQIQSQEQAHKTLIADKEAHHKTLIAEKDKAAKEKEELLREKIEEQKHASQEQKQLYQENKEMMVQRLREKDEAMDVYRAFIKEVKPKAARRPVAPGRDA